MAVPLSGASFPTLIGGRKTVRRLTAKVLDAKASALRSRIPPRRKDCLDDTLISYSKPCLVNGNSLPSR